MVKREPVSPIIKSHWLSWFLYCLTGALLNNQCAMLESKSPDKFTAMIRTKLKEISLTANNSYGNSVVLHYASLLHTVSWIISAHSLCMHILNMVDFLRGQNHQGNKRSFSPNRACMVTYLFCPSDFALMFILFALTELVKQLILYFLYNFLFIYTGIYLNCQ